MKDVSTNPFFDPGESSGTPAERPSDALGNAPWDSFETVSRREMGKSFPGVMENTEDDAPEGLYGRVKKSRLTGPLADSFTRAIDANRAAPGDTGYGMHNLSNEFVVRLMYPHSTPQGNETARALFEQSPPAYSYLTGRKSPPKPWGTYVGAKYDEEAGNRAAAEGRDLAALESQVQTAFYRPERDRSRGNQYKTMEFRTERDGRSAEMVKLNADGASPESAGGEGAAGAGGLDPGQNWSLDGGRSQADIQGTLNKAQGIINDLSAAQRTSDKPYGGSGDGYGADKLMDYFPDPSAKPENLDSEGLGDVGKKMLDVANGPGTAEDKAFRRLEDGVRNIGERVDWQVGMNEMQDKLDEKKVVWVGGKAYPWNEVYKGVESAPANGVWIYNNKTGELSIDGENISEGYSGKNTGKIKGLNNPAMLNKNSIGPIPNGIYKIGDSGYNEHMGEYVRLEETNPNFLKENDRTPGTFYVHGNKRSGGFDASAGCIILPKEIRDMMFKGETIKVISK
jgi:hypothetical protein